MSGPQRGLGRGLGELFQRTEASQSGPDAHKEPLRDDTTDTQPDLSSCGAIPKGAYFAEISTGAIAPNPKQPRSAFDDDELAELADSIHEVGLLQPVVVRPLGNGSFELVMGERRWRAAQEAGMAAIPAIVRETGDHALLRDALLENLHRAALNPLEEAAAYQQLLQDFECTQEELAGRIKRSRSQISNTIRLLRLPAAVQRRVAAGVLSAGHARALLIMEDSGAQERLAQRVVAEGLSVRALEEIVALGEFGEKTPASSSRGKRQASEREISVGQRLSDHFDTRASVAIGRNKGKLVIEFAGEEDLERILGMINPAPQPLDSVGGSPYRQSD